MQKNQPEFGPPNEWTLLLDFAARQVISGASRAEFLRGFRLFAPKVAPSLFDGAAGASNQRTVEQFAGAMGFSLWSALPQPTQGWRRASSALPGRNDPCYCGSGDKFKRCCQSIMPPTNLFDQFNLLRHVLDVLPAKQFKEIAYEALDPLAIADTAAQWIAESEHNRAEQLLAPMFDPTHDYSAKLDGRHEPAYDELMTVWMHLGKNGKRKTLTDALMHHKDATLASAARQRKVTMIADQGDWEGAWALFHESLRLQPDHPSFSQLEVTLLLQQGRTEEARARATFWSHRLRRISPDYAEFADRLVEIAENPVHAFSSPTDDEPELLSHLRLVIDARQPFDVVYELASSSAGLELQLTGPNAKAVTKLETQWRSKFLVAHPDLTSLIGDASDLCEQLAQATLFLMEHPLALQSFAVLDDLAQAFGEMGEIEPPWAAMSIKCGERARLILEAILPAELRLAFQSDQPQALTLPWIVLNNRPALRLIAREIDSRLRLHHSDPMIDALMSWMLRINPNDNHHYRYGLSTRLLRSLQTTEPARALTICERYPDSIGPLKANHLLALFNLNRRDEAQILWQVDGQDLTEIRKALLAERYARPRELDSGFVTVGGRGEAWDYRDSMRDCWIDLGAIEWLAALPKPQPKSQGKRKPDIAQAQAIATAQGGVEASPQAGAPASPQAAQFRSTDDPVKLAERVSNARREYNEIGGDAIYLHGVITGVAISPASAGSSTWVTLIFRPPTGTVPSIKSIEHANQLLAGVMTWYNLVNQEIGPLQKRPQLQQWSLPWLGDDLDVNESQQRAARWASGFMAAVQAEPAAWRGTSLSNRDQIFNPIKLLAAQAPLNRNEQSDPSSLRDRLEDKAEGSMPLQLVDDADWSVLLTRALEAICVVVGRARG
jgi:Uncharacterised protein family (UPF0149)/SEC-C motif